MRQETKSVRVCASLGVACCSQVGELFTANRPSAVKAPSSNGSSSGSLLQQVLQEDETDVSELYFGSMDAASEGSNSPEAVAWRQTSGAICQQLTPLQRSQVRIQPASKGLPEGHPALLNGLMHGLTFTTFHTVRLLLCAGSCKSCLVMRTALLATRPCNAVCGPFSIPCMALLHPLHELRAD